MIAYAGFLLEATNWLYMLLHYGAALAGVVGAVFVSTTREDAFDAADRQSKWIWFGLLLLSALVVVLHFPFLSWIGLVIIALYWWDVRPQIQSIINGSYGY